MNRFSKLDLSLKNYLVGAGYAQALKAYGFAKQYHVGTRKDGTTPEFQHQIEIALFATTLKGLIDEESVITCILLHDIMEDYDVERGLIAREFGREIEDSAWRMTKKYKGIEKDEAQVFTEIGECPVASIAKGLDRIHNQQSMPGVFTPEKQCSYIAHTESLVLPMLKRAAYNFPAQYLAYMNIRTMIKSQITLLRAALEAGHDLAAAPKRAVAP